MRKEDLAALVRSNLDLPIFKHVREQVACALPDKGYKLDEKKAWSMAGALMESYIPRNFQRLTDVYDYILKSGSGKLAMDILENILNSFLKLTNHYPYSNYSLLLFSNLLVPF